MSAPGPLPGPRPAPPPRPGPPPTAVPEPRPATVDGDLPAAPGGVGTGHPAVDAVLRGLANAATLSVADQLAEYEAAHRVLQEALAGIDQG